MNKALDRVRQYLAKDLGLISQEAHALLWITDFPMFEWNEDEQRLEVCPYHSSMRSCLASIWLYERAACLLESKNADCEICTLGTFIHIRLVLARAINIFKRMMLSNLSNKFEFEFKTAAEVASWHTNAPSSGGILNIPTKITCL